MRAWKDLFAESESMDLKQLMQRLNEKLPAESAQEPTEAVEAPSGDNSSDDGRRWREELQQANLNWNLSQYSMRSSRTGIAGWLITIYKSIVEWFVRPVSNVIVFRQAHLNANFVNLMNILERRMAKTEQRWQTLEQLIKRLGETQQELNEQFSRRITEGQSQLEKQLREVQAQAQESLKAQLGDLENRHRAALTKLQKELEEQLGQLVDEIAALFEQEEHRRQQLRRQFQDLLSREIRRLEDQWTETLLAETLGASATWKPDTGEPGAEGPGGEKTF